MTIGAIIGICVIGLIGLGCAIFAFVVAHHDKDIAAQEDRALSNIGAIIIIITIAVCVLIGWWNLNSASGRRAYKDQESNLNGGIERIVTVYDINGDIIETYKGKFDIETDRESYILFDDEHGLRHIIYYTTGTITVDEVS